VVELSGAVEISIQLGIADSAADVVETGTTIRQAGLQVILQLLF
jgi:ATP phosphoribosyltransferase